MRVRSAGEGVRAAAREFEPRRYRSHLGDERRHVLRPIEPQDLPAEGAAAQPATRTRARIEHALAALSYQLGEQVRRRQRQGQDQ